MSQSYIQLPYGVVDNEPTFNLSNPKDYETSRYFRRLPYIDDLNTPKVQNEAINLINNRDDFRKYLLATSNLGSSLQDSINQVVTDGEFNNAALRHILDNRDSDIFKVANPLSLVFKNANKFNLQNPVLGNILSQVYAGQLTDEDVKRLLSEGENLKIQARLEGLQKFNQGLDNQNDTNNNNNRGNRPFNPNNNDDDDDDDDDDGGFGNRPAPSVRPSVRPKTKRPKGPITRLSPPPSPFRLPVLDRPIHDLKDIESGIPRPKDTYSKTPYKRTSADSGTQTLRDIGSIIKQRSDQYTSTLNKPISKHIATETRIPRPKIGIKDNIDFKSLDSEKDDEIDDTIELPDVPNYDVSFDKPITRVTDDKTGTVEIIPHLRKIPSLEPILKFDGPKLHKFKKVQVKDELKVAFPELKQEIPKDSQKQTSIEPTLVVDDNFDEALKHLLETGLIDNTPNIAFFDGGINEKLEKKFLSISKSPSNVDFLAFLQTETCATIMKKNKIKIHIESGDIYYDNTNTNESIYDFIRAQENENYIMIDFDFSFDGSLRDYFNSYLQNIDEVIDSGNDFYTHRNSKYLFYRFNDLLLNLGRELHKIRHTSTIKNKIAIKIMQQKNWQYFITRLLDICWSGQIGDDQYTPEEENDLNNYFQTLISVNEIYKKFYNLIAQSFHSIFQNLPSDEKDEITEDLINHNFRLPDVNESNNNNDMLDLFIDFYNHHGRFPGNQRLIILPRFDLPTELEENNIDLREIFEQFKGTGFRSLVSVQGLCALLLSLSNNNKSAADEVRNTMKEFFGNLVENTLNIDENSKQPDFFAINRLLDSTRTYLERVNQRIILKTQEKANRLRNKLNEFADKQQQEIEDTKILVTKPKEEYPTKILTDSEIEKEKIRKEEEEILTNLAAVRAELEGLKQQRDEDDQKIISNITDPGNGNLIDDKFYSDDVPSSTETTDKPFKIPKSETPILQPEKIEIDDLFIPIPKRIPEIISEPTNDTSSYLPSGLESAIGELSTDDALIQTKKSNNSSRQASDFSSSLENAIGDISTDDALGKKGKKSRDSSRHPTDLSAFEDALGDISTDDALGKKTIGKKSRDSSRQPTDVSAFEDALGDISTDDALGKKTIGKKSRDSSRQPTDVSAFEDALRDISTDDALGKKTIGKKSRDSSRQPTDLSSGLEDALGNISTDDALGKINDGAGIDKKLLDVITSMSSDNNLTQSEEERLLASTDDGLLKNVTNESDYNNKKKRSNSPIDMYISDDDMFITLPKNSDSEPSRTIFKTEKDDVNIINDLEDKYVIPDSNFKSNIKIGEINDEPGFLPDFPDGDNIFTKSPDKKLTKRKLPSFRYRSLPYEKPKLTGLIGKKHTDMNNSIDKIEKSIKKDLDNIESEITFIKQVPSHPRDRLARKIRNIKTKTDVLTKVFGTENDDVIDELEYVKTVPSHPRDRLKRAISQYFYNLNNIKKEVITISEGDMSALTDAASDVNYDDGDDAKLIPKDYKTDSSVAEFVKQTPSHPRDRRLRALKNRSRYGSKPVYTSDSDVEFIKQVPNHPRDRLRRRVRKYNADADDELEFMKQIPVHPRDRHNRAGGQSLPEEVEFLNQIPVHPRDRYNRYGGSNLPDQVHSNTDEIIDSKKDTKPIVVLPNMSFIKLT